MDLIGALLTVKTPQIQSSIKQETERENEEERIKKLKKKKHGEWQGKKIRKICIWEEIH